ncbi:hypothetical protein M5K25_008308 [Dendrobium thyrsiflorum]|uniref:RING-type E3 ubiquitin transferase n=1 Tax=Dendrobium thyrsiflorum TaxID=117978 RepID=A0ABD0VF55_DENTH
MAASLSSSSSPMLRRTPLSKSRVTVTSSIPSRNHEQWIHPFLLLMFFLAAFPSRLSSADVSYADHCGSIVPESTPSTLREYSDSSFRLSSGYFVGGDRFFGQDPGIDFSALRSFAFYSRSVLLTDSPGTLQIVGTLIFHGGGFQFAHRNSTSRGRSLRLVRPWNTRSFKRLGRVSFDLSGFWSEETGKLCLVGTGFGRSKEGISLDLSAVFKLKYPTAANITSSVVSGYLESLESVNSTSYFDRIMVLAYAQRKYEYTKVFQAQSSCSFIHDSVDQLMGFLDRRQSICDAPGDLLRTRFKLEYGSSCSNRNCGPLYNSLGFQPAFLKFTSLDCSDDGKIRLVVLFSNYSGLSSMMMLEPGMAMVAEGSWVQTKNQLCLIACRVKAFTDALADNVVDDCTIGISLAFPAVLTIESRSTAVGNIWSNLNETNPGYFSSFIFRSFGYSGEYDNGLRYKYTKVDDARKSCTEADAYRSRKKRYPDPRNYRDFMFYLLITTYEGKLGRGFANPLALGETINRTPSMERPTLLANNQSIWNISYFLTHAYHQNAPFNSPDAADISAEGTYNSKTGVICMVGCRSFDTQGNNLVSKDCNILINIQIPPLNPEPGEHLHGTIRSTRTNLDPLFFKPLEISSHVMYERQAAQSVWRMDIEIIMILISLTFSCIFVGLQLLHINKHPGVLSSISITMLVFLTFGHMVVLVLNFEALLGNHKKQNVLQGNGGWLEVNEVVVRLMTMAAFLLHCRLLQVAWCARSANDDKNSLWFAERKTIRLCLFIYIAGGFIAWLVRLSSQKTFHQVPHITIETRHSSWEDIQTYAGLILDGFLIPQVILNALCDSKETSLAPSFYVGTTILRALPHVYDVYRSRNYIPHLNSSYIYARPNGDLYSLAWDIIIPCVGILFAVGIYIQQRFGGAPSFCRRIGSLGSYEMVPVASS